MSHATPGHENRSVTIKRWLSYAVVSCAGVGLSIMGSALPTMGGVIVGAVIGIAVHVVEFHWWEYDPTPSRRFAQGTVAIAGVIVSAGTLVWLVQFASAADIATGFVGLAVGHALAHRTFIGQSP